jgi:hypothetical protein
MTTGASNDFERATAIARDMVTRYGMTDELGPMVYAENEGEVFLGRSVTKTTSMSEDTMRKVDGVIRRIIDEQYGIARKLIEDNKDKMHSMAQALLVPLQRVAYRQVLYFALVKAMRAAIKGWAPGWGKLERTGRVAGGKPVLAYVAADVSSPAPYDGPERRTR